MATIWTTSCHRHQHPEFRITYDPASLERKVAAGERFADGETFQVGWITTQVRAGLDGALTLWEPDMLQLPVGWTESVSSTLAQLRRQKDVCESVLPVGELFFPTMRQSALICTRLGQRPGVVMERRTPSETDSGWFCGCREDGHDHDAADELRCVSLYEAVVGHASEILPYLALPEGVLLGTGDGPPTIFQHGRPLVFKHGSYLAVRHRKWM